MARPRSPARSHGVDRGQVASAPVKASAPVNASAPALCPREPPARRPPTPGQRRSRPQQPRSGERASRARRRADPVPGPGRKRGTQDAALRAGWERVKVRGQAADGRRRRYSPLTPYPGNGHAAAPATGKVGEQMCKQPFREADFHVLPAEKRVLPVASAAATIGRRGKAPVRVRVHDGGRDVGEVVREERAGRRPSDAVLVK